jgi:hypothetical protein
MFKTIKTSGHRTEFWVTGRGSFPFDMLRYDMCHPYGPDDAAEMGPPTNGMDDMSYRRWRSIRMISYAHAGPTVDRWRSFGWTCSPEKLSMSQVG